MRVVRCCCCCMIWVKEKKKDTQLNAGESRANPGHTRSRCMLPAGIGRRYRPTHRRYCHRVHQRIIIWRSPHMEISCASTIAAAAHFSVLQYMVPTRQLSRRVQRFDGSRDAPRTRCSGCASPRCPVFAATMKDCCYASGAASPMPSPYPCMHTQPSADPPRGVGARLPPRPCTDPLRGVGARRTRARTKAPLRGSSRVISEPRLGGSTASTRCFSRLRAVPRPLRDARRELSRGRAWGAPTSWWSHERRSSLRRRRSTLLRRSSLRRRRVPCADPL